MGMMSMRGMVEKAGELSCLAAKGASEGPLIRKIGTGFFFVTALSCSGVRFSEGVPDFRLTSPQISFRAFAPRYRKFLETFDLSIEYSRHSHAPVRSPSSHALNHT